VIIFREYLQKVWLRIYFRANRC